MIVNGFLTTRPYFAGDIISNFEKRNFHKNIDSCYTVNMKKDHHIWQIWADGLHRWGIKGFVTTFLEAAGPMNLLGAQAIYIGQPILNTFVSDQHLKSLANLLENSVETRRFIEFLKGKSNGYV